jgi:hypothetical protein
MKAGDALPFGGLAENVVGTFVIVGDRLVVAHGPLCESPCRLLGVFVVSGAPGCVDELRLTLEGVYGAVDLRWGYRFTRLGARRHVFTTLGYLLELLIVQDWRLRAIEISTQLELPRTVRG